MFECIQRGAEDYLLKPVSVKEMKQLWQHVWRRRYSWRREGAAAAAGAPASAKPAPAKAPLPLEEEDEEARRPGPERRSAAPPSDAPAAQPTEMYTAAEMREHCMRQIARYTRVIQVIDSHPHLFPGASGDAPAEPMAALEA